MKDDVLKSDYSLLDRPEVGRCLFHPRSENIAMHGMSPERDIFIPVEKGIMIGACFYMGRKDAPNILFFHGNGEIVADYHDMGQLYNQSGLNFMAVDYRGYGRSDGVPTATAMMSDCRSIFDFSCNWLQEKGFSGPMIVMGRSLGSASALELAALYADRIDALVVESGFADTVPLLRLLGVNTDAIGLEEGKGFGNREKIRNFTKTLLIIHAEKDHIIPFRDGQALYDNCPSADKTLLRIPGADHNNLLYVGFAEYMAAVRTLAGKTLQRT